MTVTFEVLIAQFPDLDAGELSQWIDQRWVQPERHDDDRWIFFEIDVARVHLIYDLRRRLDTPEETMPLVLSLLDQVYALRRRLAGISSALEALPPELRDAVLAAIKDGTADE